MEALAALGLAAFVAGTTVALREALRDHAQLTDEAFA